MSYPTQDQPGEDVPQNPYGTLSAPDDAVPAQPYDAVPAQPYGGIPAQPGFAPGVPAPEKSKTGKISAIVGAIVAVVVVGGIVAFMIVKPTATNVKERLSPGCIAAESYLQKRTDKAKADASNPVALKADLQDAVTELDKDAVQSTTAPTKAAILKLRGDMQEVLDDLNAGTIPPASMETQIDNDGAAIDTACGR